MALGDRRKAAVARKEAEKAAEDAERQERTATLEAMGIKAERSRREKVKESIARIQVSEGGFGGSFWYLYPDSIETHDGLYPLTYDVTATVDNEVKRQFAPGKALAVGIFGLTKKTGDVYITVEGHTFHSFGTITFRNEKAARKFAAKVNSTARGLPQPEEVEVGPAATDGLDPVVVDTSGRCFR